MDIRRFFSAILRLWIKFGECIQSVTQPIILGVIYFLVLTPVGVWRRLRGHTKMQTSFDEQKTFWTEVTRKNSVSPEQLKRQF